jgi:hypothetical protein
MKPFNFPLWVPPLPGSDQTLSFLEALLCFIWAADVAIGDLAKTLFCAVGRSLAALVVSATFDRSYVWALAIVPLRSVFV